jgi:hypothetical protein
MSRELRANTTITSKAGDLCAWVSCPRGVVVLHLASMVASLFASFEKGPSDLRCPCSLETLLSIYCPRIAARLHDKPKHREPITIASSALRMIRAHSTSDPVAPATSSDHLPLSWLSSRVCSHQPYLSDEKRGMLGRKGANEDVLPSFAVCRATKHRYWTVKVPIMYPLVIIGPSQPLELVPQGSKHRKV